MNLQSSKKRESHQQFVDGEWKVASKSERPACHLQLRRPTLNSAWIARGKSSAEVKKRLCTFSELMNIEHPLPCCNRTAAVMLRMGQRDLFQALGRGTCLQSVQIP
eukprot:s482_g10.t1